MIPPINLKDFLYDLPEEKIATHPNVKRDESNLLIRKSDGSIQKQIFKNIHQFIPAHSQLIFNNSKVFPARLIFQKSTGSYIEIFCLETRSSTVFENGFYTSEWLCMVGNLKKWKSGSLQIQTEKIFLEAHYLSKINQEHLILFKWKGTENIFEIFENIAELPLPPYMNRKANSLDLERYQTIYAQQQGSVAAPTAGLHFTSEVLECLKKSEIGINYLTLHVGAGTFKPIKSTEISQHEMHTEHFSIHTDTIKSILNSQYTIAVGTTSMRVIESLYWIALKLMSNPNFNEIELGQWEAYRLYSSEISLKNALDFLIEYLQSKNLKYLNGTTSILIMPGYNFKICKGLVTNFHQPESTLILLVAAFLGENWRKIYEFALKNDFKFLSYGDSSLLLNE